MAKFYITTAIPYVNASPHIGFALEAVQTDVIARYYRLCGYDVKFASGTDENSLKNVQAAEKEGVSTQKLVDKYAKEFENLKKSLNLSWDIFNRTSLFHHFKGAQKLWSLCKKEDIYKKIYKGLYCVECELFYTPDELVDGKCPDHKVSPEEVEEENYFFKLTNYQEFLEDLIEKDTLKIIPETRKNEVLSFIKQGLEDFSISRSKGRAKGWGVPVPGDENQVMYVWFDALITYLTALGFGTDEKFYEYWEDNPNRLHVIGKGIIRFHAIYWPAMLKSAGLPLPTSEFVHGYVTVEGEKISKSLGNTVDPVELVNKYGTDAVRYYLLREIPSYRDGDFSEERFKEVYNANLANGLGNLVARVAKLAEKNNVNTKSFRIPEKNELWNNVSDFLKSFHFNLALQLIWQEISKLDRFLDDEKPWEKSKSEANQTLEKLLTGSEATPSIIHITEALKPFLPETSEKILAQFSGKILSVPPLFPRL